MSRKQLKQELLLASQLKKEAKTKADRQAAASLYNEAYQNLKEKESEIDAKFWKDLADDLP